MQFNLLIVLYIFICLFIYLFRTIELFLNQDDMRISKRHFVGMKITEAFPGTNWKCGVHEDLMKDTFKSCDLQITWPSNHVTFKSRDLDKWPMQRQRVFWDSVAWSGIWIRRRKDSKISCLACPKVLLTNHCIDLNAMENSGKYLWKQLSLVSNCAFFSTPSEWPVLSTHYSSNIQE